LQFAIGWLRSLKGEGGPPGERAGRKETPSARSPSLAHYSPDSGRAERKMWGRATNDTCRALEVGTMAGIFLL